LEVRSAASKTPTRDFSTQKRQVPEHKSDSDSDDSDIEERLGNYQQVIEVEIRSRKKMAKKYEALKVERDALEQEKAKWDSLELEMDRLRQDPTALRAEKEAVGADRNHYQEKAEDPVNENATLERERQHLQMELNEAKDLNASGVARMGNLQQALGEAERALGVVKSQATMIRQMRW
jgi:chromosome segregation ATPase